MDEYENILNQNYLDKINSRQEPRRQEPTIDYYRRVKTIFVYMVWFCLFFLICYIGYYIFITSQYSDNKIKVRLMVNTAMDVSSKLEYGHFQNNVLKNRI
jgi:hypothetical protein